MPLISFALESVIRQPGNYSLSNMTLHFWIGTEDSAYETGMIAGILLGIVTGLATAYRTILPLIRKDGGHEPKGRSFNDHI